MQGYMLYAKEALSLVQKHSTCDPFRIAQEEGIKLLPVPFSKIYGTVFTLDGTTFIEYSALLEDEEQQKLVVAHELGHLYLHPEWSFLCVLRHTLFYNSFEYQANIFAAALRLGEHFSLYADYLNSLASKPPDRFVEELSRDVPSILSYH